VPADDRGDRTGVRRACPGHGGVRPPRFSLSPQKPALGLRKTTAYCASGSITAPRWANSALSS
jgi:hypothetical protein